MVRFISHLREIQRPDGIPGQGAGQSVFDPLANYPNLIVLLFDNAVDIAFAHSLASPLAMEAIEGGGDFSAARTGHQGGQTDDVLFDPSGLGAMAIPWLLRRWMRTGALEPLRALVV